MNEQIEPESSTENGLVSVIMIFLNAERFIEEAIESVLSQTYDRWELLLVDDGSTDRSTAIARRYAAELPDRIRYLDHTGHQNRGMSASRNMGIAHAGGEYIAFLDADDVYLPQKLEKQIEILEHYPEAGLVYGATQYWFSWTGSAADARKDRLRPLGVPPGSLVDPPHLFRLFLENKARTPCTCAVLIRRSVIKDAGGFEERFSGMYEDQVFFYKLSLIASAFVADGCWDRYRQHADSEVYACCR